MSDAPTEDVDPETLQRDLDRIKDAMGIAERNASLPDLWLLFGVAVAVACGLSQFVVLEELPGYWLSVVWLGMLGASAVVLQWRYDLSYGPGSRKPNTGFQIFVLYLGSLVVQFVATPFLGDLGYRAENAYLLGVVLLMLGLGYVVAGETLKAYRIRARDRYAMHAGGVLLVALGVAIPNVDALHTWGYAAFGATYLAYAVASYLVLTRT